MQSYAHKQYDSKNLIGVYQHTNLDRAFAEQNGFMKDRVVFHISWYGSSSLAFLQECYGCDGEV